MDFNQYQAQAKETAIFPKETALAYLSLGLTSEAGEVAGKAKKVIRDHGGVLTEDYRQALEGEIGDVLWYTAMLADYLDLELDQIATANISKLHSRKERGALGGDGDNR